ncbi:MAG: DUF4352 domain-containing protein [Thermomicrobiales bacterium]|nr:DUF4352 domain-containing protein [Thermomicrobiales bacterium]
MKKLITALLTLSMLFAGIASVAAQEEGTAFANGLGNAATYYDSRGNEVATLAVNDVDDDWQDYDQYSAPERGYVYRAVNFTVENVSGSSMIVDSYSFSLLDAEGRNTSSSWVTAAEDSDTVLFDEDVPLAAGESADLTLVFSSPEEVAAAALIWQPDYGTLVIAQIAEGGAIGNGIGGVSTYVDNRGRAVAELQVTNVEIDWQDYDDYSAPERGTIYVAVSFTITNVSNSSMIVEPYSFTMLDSSGLNSSSAWATASEESGVELFSDDVPLAAGESHEGVMIFAMYDDLSPAALVWQPDYGVINLVTLGDSGADATPAAPGGSDADATPAN